MRHRAFALVLSLVCLVAAPRLFAGKHHDDSNKDSAKSEPKKSTEKPHTQQQSPPQQQGSGRHSSGSGQTSSGNTSTATSEHSRHHQGTGEGSSAGGERPTAGDVTRQSQTSHESNGTSGTSAHNPYRSHESQQTYGTHPQHPSHNNGVRSEPAVVDRSHLHERMQVHPTYQARQHAIEHYRTERAQFHHHAAPLVLAPEHRVVLTKVRIVPTTYHYRRTVFYDEYGWTPPMYVYSMYPRYGLWDATFLMFALDHVAEEQYALMFYHHQREADFQRWLEDSNHIAEQNPELREKLDAMKVEMAKLDENGNEIDPSYVPPDAQDVALSPDVIEQLTAKASGN